MKGWISGFYIAPSEQHQILRARSIRCCFFFIMFSGLLIGKFNFICYNILYMIPDANWRVLYEYQWKAKPAVIGSFLLWQGNGAVNGKSLFFDQSLPPKHDYRYWVERIVFPALFTLESIGLIRLPHIFHDNPVHCDESGIRSIGASYVKSIQTSHNASILR